MLATARSSSAASACTRGSVSSTLTSTRWARSASRWNDLLETDVTHHELECPALEAAHVEQVAHERVQSVGFLVDRRQKLVGRLRRPLNVLLEQARRRRLDRRQRRSEVVRDGGEKR